ncbi:multicopper oxidase domain-containing protein [Aquipuribacter sp. MA13-6]|uniref:multicopper oxidase domain-containing protein n=1 Tax=unclassified Aquipuribacter TaxID=2635084 RepID=UPI003EE8D03B
MRDDDHTASGPTADRSRPMLTRREAIAAGGIGSIGLASFLLPTGPPADTKSASQLPDRLMPRPYRRAFVPEPVATPVDVVDGVVHYDITARKGTAEIVTGIRTPVYGYDGLVPGPAIHVDRGTPVRLRIRNHLPLFNEQHGHEFLLSTHLHGHPSRPQYDGYAADLSGPGYFKHYWYENDCTARSIWYHDHAQHRTAENVYGGLYAQYHLHDPWERVTLPQGEFDVALLIGDAIFDRNGGLAFDDRQRSGLWGDVILVNGVPWPVMKVRRRVYRLRILVATLARSFRFRLSTDEPVHLVGTDAGLVPRSVPLSSWRQGGAERVEVLVDFSGYAPGTRVKLLNDSNENNRDYDPTDQVMAFDVVDDPVDQADPTWDHIPDLLQDSAPMRLTAAQATRTRRFRLKRDDRTNEWQIGETSWEVVEAGGYRDVLANPALGAVERWIFENSSGGWFHPVHMHLVDFQVLSRNGAPPFPWERGPKDTVYVGESETVAVLAAFYPHQGKYMIHCHNLPHEDHAMMAQFAVGPYDADDDTTDPRTAAPPVKDYTYGHPGGPGEDPSAEPSEGPGEAPTGAPTQVPVGEPTATPTQGPNEEQPSEPPSSPTGQPTGTTSLQPTPPPTPARGRGPRGGGRPARRP